MTLRRTGLILAALLLASAAQPQETSAVCPRGEGFFYGSPITLEQVYLIPGQSSPVAPSGDSLFPDPGTGGAAVPVACEGGGIVGAIDCVTAEIEGAGATPAETPMPPVEAEARAAAEAALDGATAPAVPSEPRVVRQLLVLKPVLVPGAPGQVRYVPDGPGGIEVPEGLTEAEIAAVSPRVAARNAELLAYRGDLSLGQQDDLIRGMPVPLPTPPLPEGVSLAGDPAVLAINAECGALFRAMTETARLLQLRAEKVARIAQLKQMLQAERDKAGLLGLLWDSETADRLERIIAMEEGNLGEIDKRLGEHKATIDRRERWLESEERAQELEAIKADPERRAAETQRRRDALIEAARDSAKARWLLIEGEAAYARQLAAHDAMIKAARENGQDDLADKLEEDKTRLEAARDSWREHAQSMIDVRLREEARLMQENAADGIGPTGDATSILLAEGKNPVEEIESGARDGARAAAERRALTDSATLGGSATETYDLVDFGQDLFETNLEMQRDPTLFYGRFGSYVGGAAEAAYDGVVDLAVIGIEAGDLAGEAFESGLTDFTGYEFNTFGRENLDTLVTAGTAISETDALKLGELAGRAAAAADRRFGQMAASGEEGIRDALETTGYVTASVLGAEELAMAGSMRIASAIRDATRGAEALADVRKLAEGVTDASRLADAPPVDTPPVADPLPTSDTLKVDPEDLTDTVRIDPPSPDTPPAPDPIDPVDPDKTGPPPARDPDAPPAPDPVDPDKTGPPPARDPDAPPAPDPVDPDKTGPPPARDPDAPPDPDPDAPPSPDVDPVAPDPNAPDETPTLITGEPDPAILRPVKRADGPNPVDDLIENVAGPAPDVPPAPAVARAVPATTAERIGRLGEVIDASKLSDNQKAFFRSIASVREPGEAAARAILDGGLDPKAVLANGVLTKDELRKGVVDYLSAQTDMPPSAARIMADRTVGGVRDTLASLGVSDKVLKVFEAKLANFTPEHAMASGAWAQGIPSSRLIDEAGMAEADIRRGLDDYFRLERGVDDAAERARLVEDYLRPVTDRAAAVDIPAAARIPEGTPTVSVTARTPDGREMILTMEATAAPGFSGSFNEVLRLGPPFEGMVVRRSKIGPDAPETVIDEFGFSALADPRVSPGVIRNLDRTTVIGPNGEALHILPFEGRTAGKQMLDNPAGVPTPGQTVALDKAMRELNRNGYSWLDNHGKNYFFEPVPGLKDEWRVVVLDPGGIVKVADGTAETAREVQLALSRGLPEYQQKVEDLLKQGVPMPEISGLIERNSRTFYTLLVEEMRASVMSKLDLNFGGSLDLGETLQFRPDGLAYFPESRRLMEVEGMGLDSAYEALRLGQ
jgi:hypothetical protein